MTREAAPQPPSVRALAWATAAALGVALLVLALFVLPAEYGIDPTGVGAATGISRLAPGTVEPPGSDDPSGDAPDSVTPPLTIQTYASRFPTTTTQVFTQDGYLAESDTLMVPFPVAAPNLTKVTMKLEFVDDNTSASGERTRPDTFEIELKAPTGDVTGGILVRSEANTGGATGRATYEIRQPPFPRDIDATGEDEARAAFARNDPADATHAGEWLARVTMLEAQDGEVQGVGLPGAPGTAASDDGNTWRITITIETYALEVEAKPGTQQRHDEVTLVIPDGGELEYKLAMALGGRLDYSWRTDGPPIYVDFHGEKTGDDSGAFTRHKNGEFTTDSGALIAPFDGRHGWFWRNSSGQSVTVTLEMRGQYDIIGRV